MARTSRRHVSNLAHTIPTDPIPGYPHPSALANVQRAIRGLEQQLDFIRGSHGGLAEGVAGSGTVTSVALTMPAEFAVAGSPVIAAGTLAATWASPVTLAHGGTAAALTASNGGIFYSTATAGAILAGTGTAGQIIRSGASAAPAWSTSTYPDSVTTGRLLYGSASNVISGLVSANNAILATGGTGIPAWGTNLPTAVTIGAAYIYRAGGTDVAVGDGGTGLSAGTSGGILGYTADGTLASSIALTANALVLGGGAGATPTPLGSLGTAAQVLHGNAAGAPTWAAVNLAADVTGTLPIGSGGTGQTAKAAAFDALSPLDAIGQVIYGGVLGTGTKLLPNSTTTRKFLRNVRTAASVTATKPTNNTVTTPPGSISVSGTPTSADYVLSCIVGAGAPPTFTYQWNGVNGSTYASWATFCVNNPHVIDGGVAGTASISGDAGAGPPNGGVPGTVSDTVTVTYTPAADAPPAWDTLLSGDLPAGAALTKGDDTNVTLTLGGSPTVALMAAASITAGWTGQLGLTRGGTAASLTANTGGIVWSGAAALAILAGTATAGQALISGATASPSWWVPTAGSVLFAGTGGALAQDNTNLFWDDSTNELGIGTNSPASSLHVYVNSTATAAAARNLGLAQFDATPVSSSAEERRAVFGWVHLLGNQNQTGWNAGVYGLVEQAGTGAASNIRGVYGLSNVSAAGNVTTAVGVRAGVAIAAASTITSAASLYAEAPAASGGGVITTAYGLYIEDVTAGATDYGIYQAGTAQNYLGGALTLGTDLAVTEGGTGLSGGTSGGILGFTAAGTIASSAALTQNALVLGGGAGAMPTPMGSLGTATTVLHGAVGGPPTWGAVSLTADVTGTLALASGGTGASDAATARTNLGLGTASTPQFARLGLGVAADASDVLFVNGIARFNSTSDDVGLEIQAAVDLVSGSSQRIYMRESNAADTYGFSLIQAGNTNPTFNGTAFSAVANTFNIFRHSGAAAGTNVLIIGRDSGEAIWAGVLRTTDTTDASSTITGALRTAGGLGVAKKGYFGDSIYLAATKALDFGAGDVTLTHAADTLTFAGAASGYVFNNGNIQAGAGFKGNVVGKSGTYTAVVTDFHIVVAAGPAIPWTLTLPAATNTGAMLWIHRSDVYHGLAPGGGGTVTIDGAGADTINGAATLALSSDQTSALLIADGVSNWARVS